MDHFERRNGKVLADAERGLVMDRVRDQLRQASAKMRRLEDVLEYPPQIHPRSLISIDPHRPVAKIQRPNVIETEHVVDVTMRDQHRVQAPDTGAQRLLAEIRRSINKDLLVPVFDQDRHAKAFVSRIVGKTRLAVTGNRRNARRSACSEKGKFH